MIDAAINSKFISDYLFDLHQNIHRSTCDSVDHHPSGIPSQGTNFIYLENYSKN